MAVWNWTHGSTGHSTSHIPLKTGGTADRKRMRGNSRYAAKLRRRLKKIGVVVERIEHVKSNHLRITLENGNKVSTSLTPSCIHSFNNLLRDIKKYGGKN